jgi:hypothetical protein
MHRLCQRGLQLLHPLAGDTAIGLDRIQLLLQTCNLLSIPAVSSLETGAHALQLRRHGLRFGLDVRQLAFERGLSRKGVLFDRLQRFLQVHYYCYTACFFLVICCFY